MISVEIFSGAGGLAKGLELAGFKHVAFVENNCHACNTLRSNFSAELVNECDIQKFSFCQLGEVDVVAGGPPCQPFSLGGKHQADQDTRDLFPLAIHAIGELLPRAFVFENVKGLLRDSFSEYFEYILLRLRYPLFDTEVGTPWREDLNALKKFAGQEYEGPTYDVSFKLLNAADFGVPQVRERVVIVGLRSDLKLKWQFPEPTHSAHRLLWEQFVTCDYWDRHNISIEERNLATSLKPNSKQTLLETHGMFEPDLYPWRTVRDALTGVGHPGELGTPGDHRLQAGAKSYPGHTGSHIDWPAKTIKAGGHGVPGGENMIHFNDGSVRYFSVYEAKLIQSFPSDFAITGSWGEAMRQIGNAVPVSLAQSIGSHLKKTLTSEARNNHVLDEDRLIAIS